MIDYLKGVSEINKKPVCVMDELREKHPEKFNESGSMDYKWFESEIRPNFNIFLRHDVDSLTFNMLTKPASEGGDLNRCQVVDVMHASLIMLKKLNEKFSCRENSISITKLEEAIMWQNERTKDRNQRSAEGQNKL